MMSSCDLVPRVFQPQVSTLMKTTCSVLQIYCLIFIKSVLAKCIAISKLKVDGMLNLPISNETFHL